MKGNLLRGSVDAGLSVHDLVRDCMVRRAEATRDGGLRATQREAVALLVRAFDAQDPAVSYVSHHLFWQADRDSRVQAEPTATAEVVN